MSIHSEFALCVLMATTLDALAHDSKLVNSAVLVGHPISMICESTSPNDKIWWKFRNSKVTGDKTLYDGSHTYGEGFSVINTSKTALVLTKKAANVDDSGIYSCIIIKADIKSTTTYVADLIVFDPVCNSSNANNSVVNKSTIIELWCEIVFFEIVNSSVMAWFRGDYERLSFENIIKNNTLRSNVTLQLNANEKEIIVSFLMHFGHPHTNTSQQQSFLRATNAPDFKFRWNFHATVSYGPRNIWIENLKTSYEYGDTLVCHAEGNPLIYEWNSTATGEVKQEQKFTITKELTAGISHPYVCAVVNELLGTTAYKAINITVNEAGSTQTALLLSVLLPLLTFLFILMLVIVIQKRIIRRESVKVNTEDERNPSTGDQAAVFSLPRPDVRLSSSGTPADVNVAEEETQEVIQRENTPPYTVLTGVRPISIAPIYAQLRSDNETSNERPTYVNVGDIRFAGPLHEA